MTAIIIIVAVLLVLLLLRSNMLSNAILNTSVNYAASQAGQGLGGHSSFGGGGGFYSFFIPLRAVFLNDADRWLPIMLS